jgi:hypothetical protein
MDRLHESVKEGETTMMRQDVYPLFNPSKTITISIKDGFSIGTTRSSAVIRCMQWSDSSQGWNIEEHFMEETVEMSQLDLM